jgi:hypothetical protein
LPIGTEAIYPRKWKDGAIESAAIETGIEESDVRAQHEKRILDCCEHSTAGSRHTQQRGIRRNVHVLGTGHDEDSLVARSPGVLPGVAGLSQNRLSLGRKRRHSR